jgi:uroporphyrinogen-III synthase
LTGCVVCDPTEVDAVDAERGGQGWNDGVVAWCIGPEAASRAREHGWPNVRQLAEAADESELVELIAGERPSA